MAYLQNWFGLLPRDIATILPWSENLDKPLGSVCTGAAPRFWKWGTNTASEANRKFFWPPLFGQWGWKYCSDS